MCNFLRILCILSGLVTFSESVNILVVFPHFGRSHFSLYENLFKTLASRGHNLTVVSYFPQKHPVVNYRDIALDVKEKTSTAVISFDYFLYSRFNSYQGIHFLKKYMDKYCKMGLENKNFQSFLKEKNQFDLILFQIFTSECFMGISTLFNAPVVGLSSNLVLPWFFDWFGNPNNPSYIPDMNMELAQHMSFFERLENTFCQLYYNLGYEYVLLPTANKYSKKYLGFDLEKNRDVFYNVSLLLAPTHFTYFGAAPLVPNIIEVGGIHISPPKKLPKLFKDYIDESSHGVIYFSMGSTLKGHTFPKDKRDAFLKNFEQLPQRVIWKWENDTMEGKPKNVMLSRWTPQFEIICDPNVKVFVYHGGLLSSSEAVHCGIPQIILPQFGDQFRNSKALEDSGVAVVMKMTDVNQETVKEALAKVLSPEYQRRAKELSDRYKDRPLSAHDTAIYWIEYVARHKGASFMKSAAVKMPLYQYLLLDVIAFVLVFLVLFILVFYFLCKKLISLILSRLRGKKKTE